MSGLNFVYKIRMATIKEIPIFKKTPKGEIITTHRLTVGILIRAYCRFRGSPFYTTTPKEDTGYRRGFCLLILKLLQSPDLTLEELRKVIYQEKYCLQPRIIENHFEETLEELNKTGINYLLDIIDSFKYLISLEEINRAEPKQLHIGKNSVIGYFLRTLYVALDKLTFSELAVVYQSFKHYYTRSTYFKEYSSHNTASEYWPSGLSLDQWSRRQAELFIATQAALLTNHEQKALKPPELHNRIKSLLKSNPDLAEAHFLSYLNYLRVKEFCGAIDSLYHCFDRSAVVLSDKTDDKSKGYRFAALNLAVLHFHFGHREEALAALKEAIKTSQEANDDICLQHALSWLHCLTLTNKNKLIEHSILKSLELNLSYTMSFGIQCFVQFVGMRSGNPKQIYETLTKSDIMNCQNNYDDLISNSYSQKSCLWLLFGKTEMSSLWSQLFLFLNTDNSSVGSTYYDEGFCQAICNVSNLLLLQGEYALAHSILSLAREKFPDEPTSHVWMLCESHFACTRAMHHENWTEAEAAAQKMAVIDQSESCLRLAELYLHKQDYIGAHSCVSEVLDTCQNDANSHLRPDLHVRALILLSEIQAASAFPDAVPTGIALLLNSCLSYAIEHHMDYYTALVYLHMAHAQLLLGMPAQALKLLDCCLVQIMSHGGNFDRGRAMLLYVKCAVANSVVFDEGKRKKTIADGARMLDRVKENFEKVEAYGRVQDTLYLQAQLYNEIGYNSQRNKCAMEYRIVAEDYPTKNKNTLLRLL